ncbi:MAG TPA: multicopper oxidase domain-containing protein [Methylococcaceae bacterium]|nr:multicopper oxidase domain-containing protein [Methylococcaceae bacterium]
MKTVNRSKRVSVLCAAALLALWSGLSLAATRHYYVAAEDVTWDYAPSGKNLIHCMDGMPSCNIPEPWTDSHVFEKTRYVEYTDASFATKKDQPVWLGILGPIIRAEEGDTVKVHFLNRSAKGSYGMHPHGFRYTKDSEGGHYTGVEDGTLPGAGAEIPSGGSFVYTWVADADSAPGPGDASSKVWWYHSHIDEPADTNAGLLGPIVITKKNMANPDGSPKDVDKEFVTLFMVFNELPDARDPEPGLMHAMNGYIFGNLKGLIAKKGEKVRWHVLGMGNEVDQHTAHWHGKTLTVGAPAIARRTDVIELLPASMVTADMKADNPGEWMYHCHVADHIYAGMMTSYQILP